MRVLLENTTFLLHKVIRIAGIIRVVGIIRGRALYVEIWYVEAVQALILILFHYNILPIFQLFQEVIDSLLCKVK